MQKDSGDGDFALAARAAGRRRARTTLSRLISVPASIRNLARLDSPIKHQRHRRCVYSGALEVMIHTEDHRHTCPTSQNDV